MPARKLTLDERCAEMRQRMAALRDAMKHQSKTPLPGGLQLPPGQWTAWHVGPDLANTEASVVLLVREGADSAQRAKDHAHIILCACGAKSPYTDEHWQVQKTELAQAAPSRRKATVKRPKKQPGLHLVKPAAAGTRAA